MNADCDVLQALRADNKAEGESQQFEAGLIDDGWLYCMEQLSRWNDMVDTVTARLGGSLETVWGDGNKVRTAYHTHLNLHSAILGLERDESRLLL